jgi:hypothetical protein
MFIGLVLGVVAAAGVVWYMNKSPLPFNKQVLENNAARQRHNRPADGAAGQAG